jgi:hypothetical protein
VATNSLLRISRIYKTGFLGVTLLVVIVSSACKTSPSQAETSSVNQATQTTQPLAAIPTRSPYELNRESIAPLIKAELTQTLEGVLPNGTWARTYGPLVEAGILTCNFDSLMKSYSRCQPGPRAKNLRKGNNSMILTVGKRIPRVTGISRIDSTSAVAQVDLTFEPSPGYKDFTNVGKGFMQCVTKSAQRTVQAFSECDTQNERHTVHLRLYDDGWRVERVD